ncbi:MAG: hypothetical protein JRI34_02675 [Deltaproteobacteria bacterium]|nr:hypothetical protein [Deltaproteobacteria bacterium]
MADYPKEIEISRLMNAAEVFGWEKVKEEVIGQEIHVTVKKKLLSEEAVSETAVPS